MATPEDVDTAMRLGFNYPRGPFEWAEAIGPARVVSVLDALRSELGEERYRAAPSLRRAAAGDGPLAPPAGAATAPLAGAGQKSHPGEQARRSRS